MSSAQEAGATNIYFSDSMETRKVLAASGRTPGVSQGTLTPTGETWQALPQLGLNMAAWSNPGSKIVWTFVADATDIVESEESTISLPGYLVPVQNGRLNWAAKIFRPLVAQDFVGFQPSATVDITATAAIEARLGAFTVPDGYAYAVGGGPFHSYLGDDT